MILYKYVCQGRGCHNNAHCLLVISFSQSLSKTKPFYGYPITVARVLGKMITSLPLTTPRMLTPSCLPVPQKKGIGTIVPSAELLQKWCPTNMIKKAFHNKAFFHQTLILMYIYRFLMMTKYKQTRFLQETFKVKQTEIASRLIQDQANKIKKKIRS